MSQENLQNINPPEDIFLYEQVPASSRLVIMFSDASAKRFRGYKTLQNAPVNRLFVRDPTRSWYNGPVEGWWDNADGLLERLRTITHRFDPANIVCMGGSMGGYAAILFGCKLGIGKIVAFSPQMILDSRLPNNPYTLHDIQYKNAYDVIAHASNTSIDILFGSEDLCDTYNMLDAQKYNQIKLLNIYGSAHNLMHHLSVHGVLSKIMAKYATSGKLSIRLPVCAFHKDRRAMKLLLASVEAYYFHSPKAAIPHLEALTKSIPQWSAAHCWLGMAKARANDDTGAVEAFRQAINRVTHHDKPLLELGIVLTRLGQYQEAESAIIRAMQLAPEPTGFHYHRLGITHLLQDRLLEAKQAQEHALELGMPEGRGVEYQLGLINNKLGKYAEAVPYFERALALGDRNPNLKKHLVTALFHSTPPESFDRPRAAQLCPEHPLLKK